MALQTPIRFFYSHAGYSYDPKTETKNQGRWRCARALAEAEAFATSHARWLFVWCDDLAGCIGCDCGSADCACASGRPHEVLFARLDDGYGRTLASLGGICEPSDGYRRVINAELACEAMAAKEGSK